MASKLTEHKPLLWQLYIERNLTAKQIAKYMQEEHQVEHSEGVYQRAFKKWDFKKTRNGNDWVWVDKKQREREALGKKTQFTFKNQIMDDAKIRKEVSRNVSTVQQIATVTTPETPSGWAAITPTAFTPGHESSDCHTVRDGNPVKQEVNTGTSLEVDIANHGLVIYTAPARQNDIYAKIIRLVQSWRAYLAHAKAEVLPDEQYLYGYLDSMIFEHLNVTRSILSALLGTPFVVSTKYASMQHLLRMDLVDISFRFNRFFERTQRTTDDICLSHGAECNSKNILATHYFLLSFHLDRLIWFLDFSVMKSKYHLDVNLSAFSTRQDTTLHIAAASALNAYAEEPLSSPYLYSRLIWSNESPNPFYSGCSPQPRRVSSSQTPIPASSPDTEVQNWPSPPIPELVW